MKTRNISTLRHFGCYTLFSTLLFCVLDLNNAYAQVTLAPLFRDNAVLQRDKSVPVWGRATPGEKVTVHFADQNINTVADESGHWRVTLAAMPACAEPADMTVSGNNTLTVHHVLIGEVWLCSGQSNMAWLIKNSLNPKEEIAEANHPLIRHFKVPLVAASAPAEECGGEWEVCNPQTVGGFSAVAYYFGRELHRKLGVPIGIINSSWGATAIESWMSPQALAADPAGPNAVERLQNTSDELHKKPSTLYHAMVSPLLPYALRGVIWYQGEANASRYEEYRTLFPSMINQWREDFKQGDIPFYYVQLAAYNTKAPWAFQREAQQYALRLPATGEALTIDIGDPDNIHPKNKQEVGRRLALNAFAGIYGIDIEYSGPVHSGIVAEGERLRVKFAHASGLFSHDSTLFGFEIAEKDNKYVSANAVIESESVVVYSNQVSKPVAVRYAWASNPPAPLFNAAGLPASPFQATITPNKQEKSDERTVAAENYIKKYPLEHIVVTINQDNWYLAYVRTNFRVAPDYLPDLGEIKGPLSGKKLDSRLVPHYNRMYDAAKADGVILKALGCYRTMEFQESLFNGRVRQRIKEGMTEEEAIWHTFERVAYPGASEHNLGLAVDFAGNNDTNSSKFDQTDQFEWLMANAADYGFILRNPADKTKITGTVFEPWHWRYVGVAAAKEIKAQGICLEEYLDMPQRLTWEEIKELKAKGVNIKEYLYQQLSLSKWRIFHQL